jgi:hypothetical protein
MMQADRKFQRKNGRSQTTVKTYTQWEDKQNLLRDSHK